jgi:hypothetical protein
MDAVMKAVHDYGHNNSNPVASRMAEKPVEGIELYYAHITKIVVQEDFTQLEKIAQQNRVEKGRLLGGAWKNNEFFLATAYPSPGDEPAYQARIELLRKWIAAHPESSAARISLAELYNYYASFARGEGSADSVTDHQWKLFHERTALAVQLLMDATRLKERDPHWYSVWQMVAQNDAWSKAAMRDLLSQALSFEPDYYHFYRAHAQLLRPMWFGEPGEIQSFAEEVSSVRPEPNSSILYFQVMSSLACYCDWSLQELPHASWPKLRQGYVGLTQLYGNDNVIANRFAYFAMMFGDKAAAREGFNSTSNALLETWRTQEFFDSSREWANSP